MERRMGFAPVDGAHLYFEATGEGPAVALIHGRGVDHRMWGGLDQRLSRHYTVVNYDLRGFGQSPPARTAYSHGDDLARLLDHLGIERVTPIGISLGGGAAINFAVSYPERLRGLVVIDGSLGGFKWSSQMNELLGGVARLAAAYGVERAHAEYLATPLFAGLDDPDTLAVFRQMLREYSGWHWTNPDTGRALSPPAIELLGAIRAPTLVIVGEHDLPDFHAIADTLERGIQGARRVTMRGVGHLPNLEAPAGFEALLFEFLAQLDGARSPRAATGPGT